jgi:hypothetical protein
VDELEERLAAYTGEDAGRADLNFALGEVSSRAGEHRRACAHFRTANRQAGIRHGDRVPARSNRRAIEITDAAFFSARGKIISLPLIPTLLCYPTICGYASRCSA